MNRTAAHRPQIELAEGLVRVSSTLTTGTVTEYRVRRGPGFFLESRRYTGAPPPGGWTVVAHDGSEAGSERGGRTSAPGSGGSRERHLGSERPT